MYKQFFKFNESVNDKNIFKAVFVVGGPGSGKSFMANLMFGLKDTVDSGRVVGSTLLSWSGELGAKVVNPDEITEIYLDRQGLSKEYVTDYDIEKAKSEEERQQLIDLQNQQQTSRTAGKRINSLRKAQFIDGMLPLIIDGTGKDFGEVKEAGEKLKSIGYDIFMVFVNTKLEVALDRNAKRERVVDPKLVEKIWYLVQNNLGLFQGYFGKSNFLVVDLSKNVQELEGEEVDNFKKKLKAAKSFFTKPLQNHIGKNLVQYMKAKGYKYLSDIPEFEVPYIE